MGDRTEKCWRCSGDGHFWRVPDGFNPFLAGAIQTAAVSRKVWCFECRGTGKVEAPEELPAAPRDMQEVKG